jgi:plasmid stabilization system protein ParE
MAKIELTAAADQDLTDIYIYSRQQFGAPQAEAANPVFFRRAQERRHSASIAHSEVARHGR